MSAQGRPSAVPQRTSTAGRAKILARGAIKRPTRLLERQWPWLFFTIVTAGALGFFMLLVFGGLFDRFDTSFGGRNLRGYTATGITLGIAAVVLIGLTFFYSLRKRSLQEAMPLGKGTMMTWLWVHVYIGILALVVAMLHAGFGLVSGNMFTSGKVLFFLLALIMVSGVAWRLVYRIVPPNAAPRVGNYSQLGTQKRAEEQLVEVEKIAAGKPAEFHALKTWLLEGDRSASEVQQAAQRLPPDFQGDLFEIYKHAQSRSRALLRNKLQSHYTSLLQGWRILHVPLTILLLVMLVVHIVGALDVPTRVLPLSVAAHTPWNGFASSEACANCHQTIYDQWSSSMHAHALSSPVMIAQTNQDAKVTLAGQPAPDPLFVCVNCHSPTGTLLEKQETLPLNDDARFHEGIACTACHQYDGDPSPGIAGMSSWQKDLDRGRVYLGPIKDPVGNGFHLSDEGDIFKDPDKLCASCHDVNYDLDHDGKIVKGVDLVLQQTFDEYTDYKKAGGKESCVSCHMAVMKGANRVADGASVLFDQDFPAPDRQVHDHSFVGVDYPLDVAPKDDVQKDKRAALLKSSAQLHIDTTSGLIAGGALTFKVTVTNTGAGHNLPTGFAFARQMWLEVKIADREGATFYSSGVLAKNTDDLCDAGTLDDNGHPSKAFVQGCDKSDPDLVSFQLKLVDHIDILRDKTGGKLKDDRGDFILTQTDKAKETPLQFLTGGPVARTRPLDNKPEPPLSQNETRTVAYKVPLVGRFGGEANVSVRLLFRNLPPYMLRELAQAQPKGETPQIAPLLKNLQLVEMATDKATLRAR
jgi:hypothetical protein